MTVGGRVGRFVAAAVAIEARVAVWVGAVVTAVVGVDEGVGSTGVGVLL